MISFESFRFSIEVRICIPLSFVSFSMMSCTVVIGLPLLLGQSDFQSRTLFATLHHMTCQTKTPVSCYGGDPREGAFSSCSCDCAMSRLGFFAALVCRCRLVNFVHSLY